MYTPYTLPYVSTLATSPELYLNNKLTNISVFPSPMSLSSKLAYEGGEVMRMPEVGEPRS